MRVGSAFESTIRLWASACAVRAADVRRLVEFWRTSVSASRHECSTLADGGTASSIGSLTVGKLGSGCVAATADGAGCEGFCGATAGPAGAPGRDERAERAQRVRACSPVLRAARRCRLRKSGGSKPNPSEHPPDLPESHGEAIVKTRAHAKGLAPTLRHKFARALFQDERRARAHVSSCRSARSLDQSRARISNCWALVSWPAPWSACA